MRKVSDVSNAKTMLLQGLRYYLKQTTAIKGRKYLAAQALGLNPTLFNQIEGNLHNKVSLDRLLRLCIEARIPVTIRLDEEGFTEVDFPTLPEDQSGP